jgi:hypothetical protein
VGDRLVWNVNSTGGGGGQITPDDSGAFLGGDHNVAIPHTQYDLRPKVREVVEHSSGQHIRNLVVTAATDQQILEASNLWVTESIVRVRLPFDATAAFVSPETWSSVPMQRPVVRDELSTAGSTHRNAAFGLQRLAGWV